MHAVTEHAGIQIISPTGMACMAPIRLLFIITIGIFTAVPLACRETTQDRQAAPASPPPGTHSTLREAADELGIWLGTTIQGEFLQRDELYGATIATEFNSAVAFVYMRLLQPEPDRFDLQRIDDAVAFAEENDIKLVGASLVYRNQTAPGWLHFDRPDCGDWSEEDLDAIMRQFIHRIVSHGGDHFYAWKVVNEPFPPPGELPVCWHRVMGEDYIVKAFRYARKANPDAILILNETFGKKGVDHKKADRFFSLVERLLQEDTPIDAVGIEMHLNAHQLRPTYIEEFRDFLERAAALDLQVHVTEMDVYQGPPGFFEDPFEHQKAIYRNILTAYLEYEHCTAFTVWGMSDKHSWLKIKEKKPYQDAKPLLFDEAYRKKPAYYGLLEALTEKIHNQQGDD
jgi:endo-1,4-beta-xylanase